MTDKQIIIDGVDVSGCPHYIHKDGSCSSHDCECVKCVHNVCFYKDYKAKEQEYEELELENYELNELFDRLKAENDELKKQVDITQMFLDACNNSCEHYKQTLTEIKEIAEPYQKDIDKICGNCRRYDGCHACCMDTLNNYEYRTGTTKACDKFIELKEFEINKIANQILQKISECEVNYGL